MIKVVDSIIGSGKASYMVNEMSKLDRVGYYDKETGEELSDEIFSSIKKEEDKKKYFYLFNKLNSFPLELTTEEFELIRKLQGIRNPHKVNLKYVRGYFMVSQNEEKIYENLNELTVYMLHMCGYRMNKDGLLKYKNGRAIKSFKELREFYNLSHYKWRVIQEEISKFSLIKEQIHDGDTYLVLNPLYTSSQYEITMYKFMAFHRELREYLDPIEYLYLCRKFDIIP